MTITYSRKGRRKHRKRKGKTCRDRTLVDYRKPPATPDSTNASSGGCSKRQLRGFPTSIVEPRQAYPPSKSAESKDENEIIFYLRKKQIGVRGGGIGGGGYSTPLSRKPSYSVFHDASSEEDSSAREFRSITCSESTGFASKKESWTSPSPSPCCVMSGIPTLTPRRSIIRSLSSDSIDSLDSININLADLPSFHSSHTEHSSARLSSPRRTRQRLSIPVTSFSDAGLNLLLKMHEELREVTAEAERERLANKEKLPKRSKSLQRKVKEINKELSNKVVQQAISPPRDTTIVKASMTDPGAALDAPSKLKSKSPKSREKKVKGKKTLTNKPTNDTMGMTSTAPPKRPKRDQRKLIEKTVVPNTPVSDTREKTASTPTKRSKSDHRKVKEKPQNQTTHALPVTIPRISVSSLSEYDVELVKSTVSDSSKSKKAQPKHSKIHNESVVVTDKSPKLTKHIAPKPIHRTTDTTPTDKESANDTVMDPAQEPSMTQPKRSKSRQRMVKEMHMQLSQHIVLEVFPRVSVATPSRDTVTKSREAASDSPVKAPRRLVDALEATSVIQTIIDDREEDRLEQEKKAKHPSALTSTRRLGSRVQQAIYSLGFQ